MLIPARRLASLDRPGLARALRPLWEDAGPLVECLAGRAVGTWDEHLAMADEAIAEMAADQRAALLRAHPRIGMDPSVLAARSALSWSEQGGAMPHTSTTSTSLASLNDRYECRFGFPFVEWVAGRSTEELIAVLQSRLARDRATELEAGCGALVAIARDRLSYLRSALS